jgi:hypothetical protein
MGCIPLNWLQKIVKLALQKLKPPQILRISRKTVKMAEHFSLKKERYDFSPLYTLIILLAAGSDQSQSIST